MEILKDSTREWYSFCFSFENSSRKLKVVINGDPLFTDVVKGSLTVSPDLLKNIQIMSSSAGIFQGFMGKLTQLNIWSISLDTEFMISWTNCKNSQKGNLLEWNTNYWILEGNMSLLFSRSAGQTE